MPNRPTARGEVFAGKRKNYDNKKSPEYTDRKEQLRELVSEIGRNRDPGRLLQRKMKRSRKNREAEKKRREKW